MARARTGCLEELQSKDGKVYYRVRVLLTDKTRARVDVPEAHGCSKEHAQLYAATVQAREDKTGELLAAKRLREANRRAQRDASRGETCTIYHDASPSSVGARERRTRSTTRQFGASGSRP
jgi:hypothetical protein